MLRSDEISIATNVDSQLRAVAMKLLLKASRAAPNCSR
jgi:hypothetical protein